MYAQNETQSPRDYHKKLELQESLLRQSLRHLSGLCDGAVEHDGQGFNGVDAEFGHELAKLPCLSPKQSFAAWKMLRKYWRQLKKADVILPKKYLNHYFLLPNDDGAIIQNLSKGSEYTLTWIGDDNLSCTCEAYVSGSECGHVEYGLTYLTPPQIIETPAAMTTAVDQPSKPIITPMLQPVPSVVQSTAAAPEAETTVELLPGITATPEQAIALRELIAFANGDKAIHGLFGFAGTGKTVLLQGWLKALRESGYTKPIVFTAYSNKAVNVLQGMVDRWNLSIECQTCAKLLGLKPRIDPKSGEQYFDRAYGEECTIGDYAIVVVDECSMVGSTKTHKGLWEHLTESAGLFTKLLFVGDYAQLPPINEPVSKVFLEIKEPSQLTQVKRYRGAIADIATDLRENLSRRGEPYFETAYNHDGSEGLFVLNQKSWLENSIKAFGSEKYLLDPNYVRCLAWTNKRIAELNEHIRRSIRGELAPRFVIGERLIASEHFFRQEFGSAEGFPTSQEMEVVEVFEGTQGGYECWFLTVQLFDKEGTQMVVPVLHEHSRKAFETDQKELKEQKLWQSYYERHGQFAWVDYAYAMTVHKSQGSTFTNVFVDVADILKDKTRNTFTWLDGRKELIWERNQLLYVALTRASHRVFIYE